MLGEKVAHTVVAGTSATETQPLLTGNEEVKQLFSLGQKGTTQNAAQTRPAGSSTAGYFMFD